MTVDEAPVISILSTHRTTTSSAVLRRTRKAFTLRREGDAVAFANTHSFAVSHALPS